MRNLIRSFVLAIVVVFSIVVSINAQTLPVTEVPSGFGRYCSVTYPSGGWAFVTLTGKNSDPCKQILQSAPGGTIQRAGLWSTAKNNNVLRMCDGDVGIYRDKGSAAPSVAHAEATGKKNCIFTVAPTAIHVFSRPYFLLPGTTVPKPNPFDFNFYDKSLNVADFGQQRNSNCPTSQYIDRSGQQNCNTSVNNHGAYDWRMPNGTPMLAVSAGIVREARWRDVTAFNCGSDKQGEIYIEHKIGTGEYAERFVTYYAHVSKINVKRGDQVTRGQVVGRSGDSGCSSAPHLHFGVFRTTNLSGHRTLNLSYPPSGYGVSAIQGMIDPFGWNAPKHIDPWAWAFLGTQNDGILGQITNPGAFSLYLWREGQAPRSN